MALPTLVVPRTLQGRLQTRTKSNRFVRGLPTLGASSFLESVQFNNALDSLMKVSFPKIYGANWIQQMPPLTYDQVKAILKAAMYYYGLGYSTKDVSFRTSIQKSFPKIAPLNVTKLLQLITGIDESIYPGDIALLKTGKAVASAIAKQNEIASKQASEDLAYEIKDKIDRGVSALTDAAGNAASTVNKMLPWYLKPTTLIPVGILGFVAYMWIQKKGVKALLRPIYKMNPISPKRAIAKSTFEMFHEAKPKKTIALPKIDTSELIELGKGVEIGYRSKKWTGKPENYLHKFGKGVRLMCTPDRKTLVLHGGQMEVKNIGIVN